MHLFGAALGRYKPGHGETAESGLGEVGSVLQGAAVHRRGDPLGGPLVPHVPGSYRDLELMPADCGVELAHTSVFRWVQAYAPEIEKRIRSHLRPSNGSRRVDETLAQ